MRKEQKGNICSAVLNSTLLSLTQNCLHRKEKGAVVSYFYKCVIYLTGMSRSSDSESRSPGHIVALGFTCVREVGVFIPEDQKGLCSASGRKCCLHRNPSCPLLACQGDPVEQNECQSAMPEF